jgi:uncharacterized protein
MSSLQVIQDFLSQKRLAVVGVSRHSKDFSLALFRELHERGYEVVPVNPAAEEIDEKPCFARLQAIHPPVDGALLMTSPAVTSTVVRDCAEAGIKRVWMYRAGGAGAASPEAIKYYKEHGIAVIPGECPFMFFPEAGWFHRFHGMLRKITGSYPY